jgi:hypothetical protein
VFPLQIYGSVGPEEENNAEDVTSVGNSLIDLGLAGARESAVSGAWDNRLDATVKSFQLDNGLDVDGVLLPGGPTETAINRSLERARTTSPLDGEDLAAHGGDYRSATKDLSDASYPSPERIARFGGHALSDRSGPTRACRGAIRMLFALVSVRPMRSPTASASRRRSSTIF